MTDSREMTTAERRRYKPEPCRVCGGRVTVIGWDDLSTLETAGGAWIPKRRCTNRNCDSNAGTIADPAP